MTIKVSTIIDDALKEINVINEVQSASAEQASKALRKLNQLMEVWREDSLNFGWVKATATTDTAVVPDFAELAVTLALAVYIAPEFSTQASQTTIALADAAVEGLRRKLIDEELETIDNSQLPIGTGRWGSGYDITTDS